jgi:serine/threonine-protein kinase RsbW
MDRDTRGDKLEVDTFLDSVLESVDRAEELVVDVVRKAGIDEDDALSLGMAVRECAVNAVVHGNRYNLNKKVHLTIARTPAQVVIKIVDEGEGFELQGLPDPLAEENLLRHSGRGIFIIRAFTDDFKVRRLSPSGTEVTLVKNVTQAL